MAVPRAEIQTLTPGALVELFVVDATALGGSVYRLCPMQTSGGANIVWQAQTYTAFPIEGSGFEASTQGALPHPTLTVSNIDGLMSGLVDTLGDLVGAVVTRKRVLAKYLDAANSIPGGTPDSTAGFADDVWVIEQKKAETYASIQFDLVAASDAQGLRIPARMILATTCPFAYKNADGTGLCPYAGALASCARTVTDCRAHFPTGPLPFGGFPGALQVG